MTAATDQREHDRYDQPTFRRSRATRLQECLDRLLGRWRVPPPTAPRVVVLSGDAERRVLLEQRCRSSAAVIGSVEVGPALVPTLVDQTDAAIVDLDGFSIDPVWLVDTLRARHPDLRLVVCGDDTTHFDEIFEAGADAWVPTTAEPITLAAAMTGVVRR